ncbi:MAG TPA: pantetheine-phosphate adenylyltransferase [Clostridiaceae bacterium]|nr:pantetheine-phosphate adenylyltransferase [Clostridiaceae bacterium]
MKICVCPGSFDPITNGHVDIIERAAKMFDKVIVAVLVNKSKVPVFTLDERLKLINKVFEGRKNIEVDSFSGLLIDFARMKGASVIIKGLRAVSDFEYEFQMALLNKSLDSNIETMFMMTNINYSFLSSSAVRELARLGGNIEGLVPDCIIDMVMEKFTK